MSTGTSTTNKACNDLSEVICRIICLHTHLRLHTHLSFYYNIVFDSGCGRCYHYYHMMMVVLVRSSNGSSNVSDAVQYLHGDKSVPVYSSATHYIYSEAVKVL